MRIEDMLDHVEQEPTEAEMCFARKMQSCLAQLAHANTPEQRAHVLRQTLCPSLIDKPTKINGILEGEVRVMEQQMPPRCTRCGLYIPPERVANAIKRGRVPLYCGNECAAQRYHHRNSKRSNVKHIHHDEHAATPQECAQCCKLIAQAGGVIGMEPIPCKGCGTPISFHKVIEQVTHGRTPSYCTLGCEWKHGVSIAHQRRHAKQKKHTCKSQGRWGRYDEECARCQELQLAPPSRQALFEQAKREAART